MPFFFFFINLILFALFYFFPVVENERATELSAVWQQLPGGFRELSVARVFHAQLYPFAAATQGGLGSLRVAYTLVGVRDKLQWCHRLMSF